MNHEFRMSWKELCSVLSDKQWRIQSAHQRAHYVPCLYFKEVRDTYIYTTEKGIHFCLFRADCLHGVLFKRLGWYSIPWLFCFGVLHTSTHVHPLHSTLMEKSYINLLLPLAGNHPRLPQFPAWECNSY